MKRLFLLLIPALLITGVLIMLFNFRSLDVSRHQQDGPPLDLKAYFSGPVHGWGFVQDWRGRVVSRFDVKMQGEWEGETGTLTEDFSWYDGEPQRRVWTITRTGGGGFEGEADDIIGKAAGQISGNAARWNYVMDLPVGGTSYRLSFDDWMWLMNDDVLINRSYFKKFGFTVAELTLFMQKQ